MRDMTRDQLEDYVDQLEARLALIEANRRVERHNAGTTQEPHVGGSSTQSNLQSTEKE